MSLSPGARLGPYEILSPIGAGGMGEVYRARDTRLGREVAIKVLHGAVARDADLLRRFEQEARAAGLLNHPNITAVYDIGRHEGSTYVVQELLEGKTLQVVLREGPLSPRRAIDYAVQIAHGLAAAHEKGIIHRDLKPANLFLTRDGRVKILDFGLAKLVGPEISSPPQTDLPTASPSTKPGVLLGTIGYISPEQLRGQSGEDRSDIFSFGVVLYEMLSGSQPFLRSSPADTMMAILSEDPPPLVNPSRGISPALDRIVSRCLEKTADLRFRHVRDIAFALESVGADAVEDRSSARALPWLFVAAGAVSVLVAVALLRRATGNAHERPVAVLRPRASPPTIVVPRRSPGWIEAPPTTVPAQPSPRTAGSGSLLRHSPAKQLAESAPAPLAQAAETPARPGSTSVPASAAPTAELTRPIPAEPTVRPVPNDSDLIRETLREYERALDTLDVDRYVRIFPSFAGERRRELESSWRGLKSQHVELEIHQIEPTGDRAVVRARHLLAAIPLVGHEQRDLREAVFLLEKRGGSWIITAFR